MLRADEIEALRDAASDLLQPVINYLLRDIAERIAKAGQLTATAQYETWKLQQLGVSQRDLRNYLKKALKVSNAKLRQLLTQSAEVGYNYDLSALPTVRAIPFEENEAVQQIVRAAIAQTQGTLENLTQTLGMVDPYGNVNPLRDTYRKCMDYAFEQVSSGAVDYNTAIREATRNLAAKGVEFIDYESGVTTSLEAAVRRNIMGALGLMQEQISQYNHDQYGATGWEIDAHSNSAPDHEPIQGKQYTDAEYEMLNNSLVRRIGTLNCGHSAHPIVYGASVPQYTTEELEEMRQKNEKGITFRGKHYTGYDATQRQRRLERAIRSQKRKILIDKATGDAENLETDQIKLQLLRQEYKAFSKAAGLRTQHERLEKVGYSWKQERAAEKAYAEWEKRREQNVERSINKEVELSYNLVGVNNIYRGSATPAIGNVELGAGYDVNTHKNEMEVAEIIHREYGGDIRLLTESPVDGEKTPDYIWNDKFWELKNTSTEKAVDSAIRKGLKQVAGNPGGIVLDFGKNEVVMDEVLKRISDRVGRKSDIPVDVMILQNGTITEIVRYKK